MEKKKQLKEDYKKLNKENKVISYLSLKNMKSDIYKYGYTYSNKKYALMVLASIACTVGFAYIYQLKPFCISIVLITILLCVPSLIRARFKGTFQERKFNDVDIYLHQMAFSFQKNPKILSALEDTERVATGKLKVTLRKAIISIEESTSSNIYENAFAIIQKAYNNSRVAALHKFMYKIETSGGKYGTALNIILGDVNNWVNRTYLMQNEVKNIKKNTMVGLLLGFVMGASTVMFTKAMGRNGSLLGSTDISQDILYQITSVVFICVSILFFTYTQTHYNYDWVEKVRNDKYIMRDYKTATEFDAKNFIKKMIPMYIIIFLVAVAVALIDVIPYHLFIGAGLLLLDVYMVISPTFTKKSAIDKTRKNVQDAFGEWLRDVSINLQDEPLIPAIQDTYENCPAVLKPELTIFLTRALNDPTAVEPYYEFLARFKIEDINSAIRSLYSLSSMDSDIVDEQLNQLVERNYEFIDKSEAACTQDTNAVMRFTEYIPTIVAAFKMAADMLSMVMTML